MNVLYDSTYNVGKNNTESLRYRVAPRKFYSTSQRWVKKEHIKLQSVNISIVENKLKNKNKILKYHLIIQ